MTIAHVHVHIHYIFLRYLQHAYDFMQSAAKHLDVVYTNIYMYTHA